MDIQYYGANCIKITTKKATIVIDDNLDDLGKKQIEKSQDIVINTTKKTNNSINKLYIDIPGEYEVSNTSIIGIPARAHIDESGKRATIYKIIANDINILVTGHIYPELSEDQLEQIGNIDIMVVPVGGMGYTVDPIGAQKLIKNIEPKVVIPTHYQQPDINYPVQQGSLEDALKILGADNIEKTDRLRLKSNDFVGISKVINLSVL